jgi:hypothetical protein
MSLEFIFKSFDKRNGKLETNESKSVKLFAANIACNSLVFNEIYINIGSFIDEDVEVVVDESILLEDDNELDEVVSLEDDTELDDTALDDDAISLEDDDKDKLEELELDATALDDDAISLEDDADDTLVSQN